MKLRSIFIFIALAFLGLLLLVATSSRVGNFLMKQKGREEGTIEAINAPVRTGKEGEIMPDIDLLLKDSMTHVNIRNTVSKGPIVLFYFGPDCPYCQMEIEEIVRNIEGLKGIQFYLITPYSISDMQVFYKRNDIQKYTNIVVGRDYNFKFGKYFGAQSIPYLAFYSREKKLNAAFLGNVYFDQIKSLCEE